MTTDILEKFLLSPTAERLRLVSDISTAAELRPHLGDAAVNEYQSLAAQVGSTHLAFDHPPNLIFIPGVMGSLLQSRTKGGIWWVDVRTRNHIDDLALSPDGRHDAQPENAIGPSTLDTAYEPFLTSVLARGDFGHEIFAYDWRKPLSASSQSLKNLIQQCAALTDDGKVHIVAHSMGGLILRQTLSDYGDELWPLMGRIVFIGTPHYGSPAIAGYLKNHLWGFDMLALLGKYLSRATFRTLRGVLTLLPAPKGVYPGTHAPNDEHPCANFDMYDAAAWKLDLDPSATQALQSVLTDLADTHRKLYDWHLNLPQDRRSDMLVIAGVGTKTLYRLQYDQKFWGLWEHMSKITEPIVGDLNRMGDGRVTVASAALEDVPIRFVQGVHGGLPNMPQVYDEVFRWLNRERLQLYETAGGALSEHLGAEDTASVAPHLDGTSLPPQGPEGVDLWSVEQPNPARMAELQALAESEQLHDFSRIRLL